MDAAQGVERSRIPAGTIGRSTAHSRAMSDDPGGYGYPAGRRHRSQARLPAQPRPGDGRAAASACRGHDGPAPVRRAGRAGPNGRRLRGHHLHGADPGPAGAGAASSGSSCRSSRSSTTGRRRGAGPLRRVQARGRHLRRDPAGPPRCHDGGRGQDVLGQRRLRPDRHRRRPASTPSAAAPRGASTITQQLVRQRLLAEDGAAQTQVTASASSRRSSSRSGVTQAFPGEEGKQRIIAAYLNQNYYGNETYGVKAAAEGLLRRRAGGADPRPGRDHRRAPEVARRTTTSCGTRSRSASTRRQRGAARRPSSSSRRTRRSSSAAT